MKLINKMQDGQVRPLYIRVLSLLLTVCMLFGVDGMQVLALEAAEGISELAAAQAQGGYTASVAQEAFYDADGGPAIKYTITVANTAGADLEAIAVKAVLGSALAYYKDAGETDGAGCIETIWDVQKGAAIEELNGISEEELAPYASAVVWENQAIKAGETREYVFFARLAGKAEGGNVLQALYFVGGEAVGADSIKWLNESILVAQGEDAPVENEPAQPGDETPDEEGDGQNAENTENAVPDADGSDGADEPAPTDEPAPADEPGAQAVDPNLEAYADSLFEGDTNIISFSVSQDPIGGTEVQSGATVKWNLDFQFANNAGFKYTKFANTQTQTLFDYYKDVKITIVAPEGIRILKADGANGYTISTNESGRMVIEIDLGTIDAQAGDVQRSLTVTAALGYDPETGAYDTFPAGKTFELTGAEIYCTARIEAINRDGNDNIFKVYELKESPEFKNETEITYTTEDVWAVSKQSRSYTIRTQVEGGVPVEYIVFAYEVEAAMNGASSYHEYAKGGRARFSRFTLTENPNITYTDANGAKQTIQPAKVTITPSNFDGAAVDGLTISEYATPANVTEDGAKADLTTIEGDVPVLSRYKVEVWYKNDLGSLFFEAQGYKVNNEITLEYQLETDPKAQPIDGGNADSVSEDYSDISIPARLSLKKQIQSIFNQGGDYVAGGDAIGTEFTGAAEFTITDGSGDAPQVFILVDEAYVAISNVIRVERGSLQVKPLSGDAYEPYAGEFYLLEGDYSIAETVNGIENTATGTMAGNGVTLTENGQGGYAFTLTQGQAGTITATNTDKRGGIHFGKYAVNYYQAGVGAMDEETAVRLAGAKFALYASQEDAEQGVSPLHTVESDASGIVSFEKLTPGTYYVKEVEGPGENAYLLDETVYAVTVEANKWAAPNTEGAVYNRENKENIFFRKWVVTLSRDKDQNIVVDRVAVSQEDIKNFDGKFQLQKSINGSTWTDVGSPVGLDRIQSGTGMGDDAVVVDTSYARFVGLPVYDENGDVWQYRIVESLPTAFSAYGTEGKDYETVGERTVIATLPFTLEEGMAEPSLTNTTSGEIVVEKWYYEAWSNSVKNEPAGSDDKYPNVEAILCKMDGDKLVVVDKGETVLDNIAGSISRRSRLKLTDIPMLDEYGNPIAYFWAEPTTTNGVVYVLDGTEGKTEKLYDKDGRQLDGDYYVSAQPAYAVAYDAENMATTLDNVLPYRRIVLYKKAIYVGEDGKVYYGADYVNSGTQAKIYQVYIGEDGLEHERPYTSNDGTNYTPSGNGFGVGNGPHRTLEIGYKYRIYETTIPKGYTNLKDENGVDRDYIEVDLTQTTANSREEIAKGTSVTLYDEPYRAVTMEKWKLSGNGTANLFNAVFDIYVSDKEEGPYVPYEEDGVPVTFTGNGTVSLPPHKYYRFVEQVQPGMLPPEVYATGSAMKRGGYFNAEVDGQTKRLFGFSLGSIVDEDGNISGPLPCVDGNIAPSPAFNMGVLENYENLGTFEIKKIIEKMRPDAPEVPLSGATIEIYGYVDGNKVVHRTAVSGDDGVVESPQLPVFDENGNKIKYYFREISQPEGYFLNETIYDTGEALIPCRTVKGFLLENDPMVKVNVQTTWERCEERKGQEGGGGETEQSYLNNLPGATVAAYKKVTGPDGTVHYELVAVAESQGLDAIATFEGLSRKEEYEFVLVSSGVTYESQDEQEQNYPLYASEDGSASYLLREGQDKDMVPQTLTEAQMKELNAKHYKSDGETEWTLSKQNGGNLNSHLLYTQIHVNKYCILWEEHDVPDRELYYYKDGDTSKDPDGAYVNGATFTLYRIKLSDEQLEMLRSGQNIEIPWNNGIGMEMVDTFESGSGGSTGQIDFNSVNYGDCFVYWLVETSAATAHSFYPNPYYRVLLYASDLAKLPGKITTQDTPYVDPYYKNTVDRYDVSNTHGSSSPHEYFRTYLYMNKWQGEYDDFGEPTDRTTPLGGAGFQYGFGNFNDTIWLDLFGGRVVRSMSSENSLGYLSPGAVYLADLYQMLLEDVTGQSIEDLLAAGQLGGSEEAWSAHKGMLYAAQAKNVQSLTDDTVKDLAADNGKYAKLFFEAYLATYPDGSWSVSQMENVLASTGKLGGSEWAPPDWDPNDGSACGWVSFYGHVVFKEVEPPANYLLNKNLNHLYVGIESSGPNGRANTRYFYLDEAGEFFTADPVSGNLDTSLNNGPEHKEQLVNMPDPENLVVLSKYGYELSANTVNMTDDELDEYFNNAGGGLRNSVGGTRFVLQRYDSVNEEWKFYKYVEAEKAGGYVPEAQAMEIVTEGSGRVSLNLPIGYYRLFEKETDRIYEKVLDGSDIPGDDGKTYPAARYFFVRNIRSGNYISVYNPMKVTLTVQKSALSTYGESLGGITFTLVNKDTKETYSATTGSDGNVTFTYLPAGTYTVKETIESGKLTGTFFEEFDITVGYDVRANAQGEAYITGVVSNIEKNVVNGVETPAKGTVCAFGSPDDMASGVNGSYSAISLTVHNPRKGELTINKLDFATEKIISGSPTVFNIYYKPFGAGDFLKEPNREDTYVVNTGATPPAFDPATWQQDGWEPIAQSQSTVGGRIRLTNLEPGWYAAEEISAPQYYNAMETVVHYVRGDMTENHVYVADEMNVYNIRNVYLSVRKYFDLSDFFSQLVDKVTTNYEVSFVLYVKDANKDEFYNAYDLGLTGTTGGRISYTPQFVNGKMAHDYRSFGTSIVQMGEVMRFRGESTYKVTKGDTTYELDGHYYLREDYVHVISPEDDVTNKWWISSSTYSYGGSKAMPSIKIGDDVYYDLGIYEKNNNGSVVFTNSYGFAQVIIQKVGNSGAALTGAWFYATDAAGNRLDDAECEPLGDGSYRITIPMRSNTPAEYRIYEEVAPDHYMLNPNPIIVTLKSGDVKNFGSDSTLIMEDSNGSNIYLIKYDNIHTNPNAMPLSDVLFGLYRRERTQQDDGSWGEWTEWEEVYRQITGDINSDPGVLVFDTIVIDPEAFEYAVVELENPSGYDGVDSVWHNNTRLTETVEVTDSQTGEKVTGYKLNMGYVDIGTNYTVRIYNRPLLGVTFYKTSADTPTGTPPTAYLEAYRIPDTYEPGTVLTRDDVDRLMKESKMEDSGTTDGTVTLTGNKKASFVELQLPMGTYLVVEKSANGSSHVINKDDVREVWYQVVRITVPEKGKKVTVDTPFVNVKESYSLDVEKEGPASFDRSLLESGTDAHYNLKVTVDATGPINGLTVTDSGLTATHIYNGIDDTPQAIASDASMYLDGNYYIKGVTIPTDAAYEYENMAFTRSGQAGFVPQLRAKVTFTYSDGTTEEFDQLLGMVAGAVWNVTPNANKRAVRFTVKWYDNNLKAISGYELGANFKVSADGADVGVDFRLEGQAQGDEKYYAVARIRNDVAAAYDYDSWTTTGTTIEQSATADNFATTDVPDIKAPVLRIEKTVKNRTEPTRDSAGNAVIGDELIYTITLRNLDGIAMVDPYLFDLLPRGIEFAGASENTFAGNAIIVDGSGSLRIGEVRLFADPRGYNVLQIAMQGALGVGESVSVQLETTVGSSIINYLANGTDMDNFAFVTGKDAGPIYNANPTGSAFKGNSGAWAGDLSPAVDEEKTLSEILEGRFTGHGYQSASAHTNYVSSSALRILKEVTGDLDNGAWYYGSNVAQATANSDEVTGDEGYANFRLTLDNKDQAKDLVAPVILDIMPRAGDNYDLNGVRSSKWTLEFDHIESVLVEDSDGVQLPALKDGVDYTLWFYPFAVEETNTSIIAATMKSRSFREGGWLTESPGKENIYAIAIECHNTVKVESGGRMIIIYNTTVPEMSEDEINRVAHNTARNSFSIYYDYVNSGADITKPGNIMSGNAMNSSEVAVILEPKPVAVGGMLWVDADGDGIQDAEDLTEVGAILNGEKKFSEAGFNARENKYAAYKVVQDLFDKAVVTLNPYTGAMPGTPIQVTGGALGGLYRFRFNNLTSASPAIDGENIYDDDGNLMWGRLAGGAIAKTYQLQVDFQGNVGVKYALTQPAMGGSEASHSLSPSDLYDADKGYFNTVLRDSNFTTNTTGPVSGGLTAVSERFYLHSVSSVYDLSKDVGVVFYRNLEIIKKDETGQPVEGAAFAVYGPFPEGEAAQALTNPGTAAYSGTTGKDGKLSFNDLMYFGEYIIEETAAPTGYTGDAMASGANLDSGMGKKWVLSIPREGNAPNDPSAGNNNDTDHVEVVNYPGRGTAAFTKTDKDEPGRVVSGAVFELSVESTVVANIWDGWLNTIDKLSDAEVANMGIGGVSMLRSNTVGGDGKPVAVYSLQFNTAFTDVVRAATFAGIPEGVYILEETAPAAGYTLNGMPTKWRITVTAGQTTWEVQETNADTGEKRWVAMDAPGGIADIGNQYFPSGKLTLKVNKEEKNYTSNGTAYTFNVYESDAGWSHSATSAVKATANVTGENSGSFSEITYTQAGDYYYIVEEVIPANTNHITYDTTQYRVKVEVRDTQAHNGTLEAKVVFVEKVGSDTEILLQEGSEATYNFGFVNEYNSSGSYTIPVTKYVMDGDDFYTADSRYDIQFTFVLKQGTEELSRITMTGAELFGSGNTGHQTKNFAPIQFTILDDGWTQPHVYTVDEYVEPYNNLRFPTGYTDNTESYRIEITPHDNHEGQMVVGENDIKITKAGKPVASINDIIFTNPYRPTGDTNIILHKKLDGLDGQGAGIPANTFKVYIMELMADEDGPIADASGNYQISPEDTGGGASAYVQPNGLASFIPYSGYDDIVYDGWDSAYAMAYPRLSYNKAGTYWYMVTETAPDVAGEETGGANYRYDDKVYFIKIEMTDMCDGTLARTAFEVYEDSPDNDPVKPGNTTDSGIFFLNQTLVDFSVTKVWAGSGDTQVPTDMIPPSVSVQLRRSIDGDSWENVGDAVLLNLANEWTKTWSALEKYDERHNLYIYRAFELDAGGSPLADGSTAFGSYGSHFRVNYTESELDGDTNTISGTVTNTLLDGSLTVSKVVEGSGYTGEPFTFTVKFLLKEGGEEKALSGSYPYVIKQGANRVKAEDAFLDDGAFTFTLTAGQEFTISGLPAGTYYTVNEQPGADYSTTFAVDNGMAVEGNAVTKEMNKTVSETGSTVAFTNYYASGVLPLRGEKNATNMPAIARPFTFYVYEDGSNTPLETVGTANLDVGNNGAQIVFAPDITYSLASLGGVSSKVFTYRIRESIPDGAQNGVYQGIAYDPGEYVLKVTVTDVGTGTLETAIDPASVERYVNGVKDTGYTYNENLGFVFGNSYSASGSLTISGSKFLNGSQFLHGGMEAMGADMFKFKITSGTVANGTFTPDGRVNAEVGNKAGGDIDFGTFTYSQQDIGTLWYKITELEPANYSWDSTVYYVRADISDTNMGVLQVADTLYKGTDAGPGLEPETASSIQFNNYDYTSFKVKKVWVGTEDALDAVYIVLMRTTDLVEGTWEPVDIDGDGRVDIVTLNAAGGWEMEWHKLEKTDPTSSSSNYYYKAVEVVPDGDAPNGYRELGAEDTLDGDNGGTFTPSYGIIDYEDEIPEAIIYNTLGGDIRIVKVVENSVNKDQEFTFSVVFTKVSEDGEDAEADPNAPKFASEYAYRIYDTETDVTMESGSRAMSGYPVKWENITLKEGWALEVYNLPIGTVYEVTESNIPGGYTVSYEGDGEKGRGQLTGNAPESETRVTNTYEAAGSLTLTAHKVLDDGLITTMPDGAFRFVLTGAALSGQTLSLTGTGDTQTVAADGTAAFGALSWEDKTGKHNVTGGVDYWYVLTELPADAAKYESDAGAYAIKVNVADVGHNGVLTATATMYHAQKAGSGYTLGEEITPAAGAAADSVLIFHNYTYKEVTLTKEWVGDGNVSAVARPETITVALERRETNTTRNSQPGDWTLWLDGGVQSMSAPWTMTWPDKLRAERTVNGDVISYEYRIVEVVAQNDTYVRASEIDGAGGNGKYDVTVPEGESKVVNTLRTQKLRVEKLVIGNAHDKEEDFSFTAVFTFGGLPLTGEYTYTVYAKGANGAADTVARTGSFNLENAASKGEFSLLHNQYILIAGLPYGTEYTVVEEQNDTFSTTHKVGTAAAEDGPEAAGSLAGDGTVTYTNSAIGGLEIAKVQHGGKTGDGRETFAVQVYTKATGADAAQYVLYTGFYTVTDADGETVYERTTGTDGKMTFRDGEKIGVDFEGDVDFKVVEVADENYDTTYTITDSTTEDETTTTAPAEGNSHYFATVTVTNTRKTGDLVISKAAEGGYEDAVFAFTVNLGIAADDQVQSFTVVYTKDGQQVAEPTTINLANDNTAGNVVLQAGWTATVQGVEYGRAVAVTEATVTSVKAGLTNAPLTDYRTTVNNGAEGTVYNTTVGANNTAAFVNAYRTGQLTVSKEVTGFGDMGKDFDFTLTLTDATKAIGLGGTYKYAKTTADGVEEGTFTLTGVTVDGQTGLASGTYAFTLKHGESIAFSDIPVGFTYGVAEAPVAEYETEATGADGTITTTAGTAGFTNAYTAAGTVAVTAQKTLADAELSAGLFRFELKDAEGNVIDTRQNDGDGVVEFTLAYTHEDIGHEYTYTLSEKNTGKDGVTYDSTVYTVKVKVGNAGAGALSITAEYSMDGETVDAITFGNSFAGSVTLTKTGSDGKMLAGAEFILYAKQGDGTWAPYDGETHVTGEDGKLTVEDLPAGAYAFEETKAPTGYLIETDAQGNPVRYEFAIGPEEDAVAYAEVAVEDPRDESYFFEGQLTVTKKVMDRNGTLIPSYETFYAGIFADEACTALSELVSENIVALNMNGETSASVTVTVQLPADETEAVTLYVAEVDEDGNLVVDVEGFGYTVTADKTHVSLKRRDDGTAAVEIVNHAPWDATTLVITKDALFGDEPYMPEYTFYVALFEDEGLTSRVTNVEALVFEKTTTASAAFGGLQVGKTYYVAETDENGNAIAGGRLRNGAVFEVNFPDGNEVVVSAKEDLTLSFQNVFTQGPSEPDKDIEVIPTPNTPWDDAPRTGDTSHMEWYLAAMALSAAACAGAWYSLKKKRGAKR